jgi:hypothetical protein
MVEPTWFERDLPVLRAIVELDEAPGRRGPIRGAEVARRTKFDEATVHQSLKALSLNDPPYADIKQASMAGAWMVSGVTGHARREVGQWPSPKTSVEEQVAALRAAFDQAADEAPDEASKSKIRAAAETFKGLPAQLAGAVSTAALLKLTGLG